MAEQNQSPTLPIAELRQRLLDEHERLKHELYELTGGDEAVTPTDPLLDSGGMASDQADDADALSEAERNRALTGHTQRLLTQVDEALARMDDGTYGKCTNCGRPIAQARLMALPWASLCIDCQGKSERGLLQRGQSGAR
jgi:RNA polymerase-binding protein DksA